MDHIGSIVALKEVFVKCLKFGGLFLPLIVHIVIAANITDGSVLGLCVHIRLKLIVILFC